MCLINAVYTTLKTASLARLRVTWRGASAGWFRHVRRETKVLTKKNVVLLRFTGFANYVCIWCMWFLITYIRYYRVPPRNTILQPYSPKPPKFRYFTWFILTCFVDDVTIVFTLMRIANMQTSLADRSIVVAVTSGLRTIGYRSATSAFLVVLYSHAAALNDWHVVGNIIAMLSGCQQKNMFQSRYASHLADTVMRYEKYARILGSAILK